MTDLSLAQHRSARCGFTSSAILTNYAALVIGRCGSIHSGFGSTIPQGGPRTRPPNFRAAEVSASPSPPGCPAAANARINARFAPKATEVLLPAKRRYVPQADIGT